MILYHISKKGAGIPRPVSYKYKGESRVEGCDSIIFLTPDWRAVMSRHCRGGVVHVYDVPEKVVKKSGGLKRYDHATEVVVTSENWSEVAYKGTVCEKKVKSYLKTIKSSSMYLNKKKPCSRHGHDTEHLVRIMLKVKDEYDRERAAKKLSIVKPELISDILKSMSDEKFIAWLVK